MRASLFVGGLLCAWVCSLGVAQDLEPVGGNQVVEVQIEGTRNTDAAEVFKILTLRKGDDLTQPAVRQKVDEDLRAIVALGHYQDAIVATEPVLGGQRVIYQVLEYPLIGAVEFSGNRRVGSGRLLDEIGFDRRTRVFASPEQISQYRDKLQLYYQQKSIPEVELITQTEKRGENEVTLHFIVNESRKAKVTEVHFEGNTALTDRFLAKQVKTKRSWSIIRRRLDPTQLEIDVERIKQLYRDRGYLDVQVAAREPELKEKGYSVTFNIEEGQPYTVNQITMQGNALFTTEELFSAMKTGTGQIYNESQFNTDLQGIVEKYREQGYLRASVRPELEPHRDTCRVDVVVRFAENDVVYLGNLQIQGVTNLEQPGQEPQPAPLKSKDFVVLREVRLEDNERISWTAVDRAGKIYCASEEYILDWSEIKRSKRRLDQLGYFTRNGVSFEPELTADPDVMDLILRLEEQRTGLISFGVGYSTEFGPSVFFNLQENNFLGRGMRFGLSADVGKRRTSFDLNFEEPHLFDSDVSMAWNVYDITTDKFQSRDFEDHRTGGSVRFGTELWEDVFGYIRLRYEDVEIEDVVEGVFTDVIYPEEYLNRSSSTGSVTLSLVNNTTDFPISPTSGYRNSISVETAGLVGENEFVKGIAESSFYRKVTKKLVLALNGQVGLVQGYGDTDVVPLQERFFMGGANTIRGFEYGAVGPRDHIRIFGVNADGFFEQIKEVRVGGEDMLLFKGELRYPITEVLEGVAFLDAGGTWREAGDFDLGDMRYSTGLGLRVNLPIGALIRLDFGIPLNAEGHEEKQPIHFSFGQSF